MAAFPLFCARSFKFTLSLKSPLKANWFSGLPSGTLYRLNQSTVASRYPGLFCLTSSMSTSHQWEEKTLKIGRSWRVCWSSLQLRWGLFSYCYRCRHRGRPYWSRWPSSQFLPHRSKPVFPAPSLWLLPPESTPGKLSYCVKSCKKLIWNVFCVCVCLLILPYFLCRICQWDHCLRSIPCRRPGGWGLPTSGRADRHI